MMTVDFNLKIVLHRMCNATGRWWFYRGSGLLSKTNNCKVGKKADIATATSATLESHFSWQQTKQNWKTHYCGQWWCWHSNIVQSSSILWQQRYIVIAEKKGREKEINNSPKPFFCTLAAALALVICFFKHCWFATDTGRKNISAYHISIVEQ